MTFKLGGGADTDLVHINIYDADSNELIAKYGNTEFCDCNFPNVDEGMNLANMVQYRANLSTYLGKNLYIELVDNAAEGWGIMFADAFFTYHENVPTEGVDAVNLYSPEPEEGSGNDEDGDNVIEGYYNEDYRPQFHFTPEENWMNDPNGMVYLDGEYHLFYQHNPTDKGWGPMYWGHAISTDLVNWEHHPIALFPDENGFIWSGSAVVDENNTSGFGDGNQAPLVAIFTYELGNESQTVGLAYSNDKGRTWEVYNGNPVVGMPEETKASNGGDGVFRDPKVFWNEDNNEWVFVIASGKRVDFYTSANLKDWTKVSRFENPVVNGDLGIWECTDLIKLPVTTENGIEQKWIMITSVAKGPTGGQPDKSPVSKPAFSISGG